MAYAIVGTAGHIDHGKTTLVQALTGTNTDRLAEEQRRGMTLDLGFTWFDVQGHRLAVIDVPGHEKYIANMLSGVAAVDIGLLVVSADEGVALQTREHLSILSSLCVPRLVVAMTKSDLADEITAEIIEEDIRELTLAAGYDDVTVVPVSAHTGAGLEQLTDVLLAHTAAIERAESHGPFRMPVDRSFTVEGRGCVVAGTVWQGRVCPGDQLQVLPGGQSVRVREVEVHGDTVDAADTGFRTAVNLVGVSHHDVSRGCELVAADTFQPSSRCLAEVALYDDAPEVANNRMVRLHTAAGSVEVRVLTGGPDLQPGQKSVVLLKCEQSVVLTPGQPLLLRRPGASGTFAGGRVLAGQRLEGHRTGTLLELGRRLADDQPEQALEAWLDLCGTLDEQDPRLAIDLGAEVAALVSGSGRGKLKGIVRVPGSSCLVSKTGLQTLEDLMLQRLAARSSDGKAAWTDDASLVEELRGRGPEALWRWLLEQLIQQGKIIRLQRQITVASALELQPSQQELFSSLLSRYDGERQPENVKALPELEGKSRKEVETLIKLAVSQGMLISLGDGWFLQPEVLERLRQDLKQLFQDRSELTVSDIREHWGLTRKHAVPFLEYFDKSGLTCRSGNVRTVGPQI